MSTVTNPGDMTAFGRDHVIMTGVARQMSTGWFDGPLSIKGIIRGSGVWRTPEKRHVVRPDSLLLLNDRQAYELTIDDRHETETFCVFFSRGSVEGAIAARLRGDLRLLDDPAEHSPWGLREGLRSSFTAIGERWSQLARQRTRPSVDLDWLMEALVDDLAAAELGVRGHIAGLDAVKPATRREIARRVELARDAIEANLSRSWQLADLGRVATMAPHHFQRCFRALHGETPRAYLARRRLERAHELLRDGRASVTEAGLEVGLSSLGSFSSAFRARFGKAPSQLAKRTAR